MRWMCFVALTGCVLSAQSAGPIPRFDFSAIKPSASDMREGPGGAIRRTYCGPPFGRAPSTVQYTLLYCTVQDLVRRTLDLRSYQLVLPPGQPWISSLHFDITAKSIKPVNVTEHDRRLEPLLEERFRLKWHRETRQMPVYYLSVAKGGLKLPATAAGSCIPWDRKGPPPPPPQTSETRLPTCDYSLAPGTPDGKGMGFEGTGVLMKSFARTLTGFLGRTVIDQTGFTDAFNLNIQFARDSSLAIGGLPEQSDEPSRYPNIFTALRKLGLKLEAGKGPVEVVVVDSVQRPSEN